MKFRIMNAGHTAYDSEGVLRRYVRGDVIESDEDLEKHNTPGAPRKRFERLTDLEEERLVFIEARELAKQEEDS